MNLKQESGRYILTALSMIILLSACSTNTLIGNAKTVTGLEPPTANDVSDKRQTVPLPYKVKLIGTSDDRMLCENCGNTGRKVLIKGGEKFSQYNMMVESPYLVFLCTRSVGGCWTGSWIAINKSLARPHVKKIWLGDGSEIRNLVPTNNQHKTWLHINYLNGTQKVFEFENDR